ncbi:MAG TPA: hypothetical protein VGN52_21830 [Burkholderiales bacterium]|jgi:hypothetical protein
MRWRAASIRALWLSAALIGAAPWALTAPRAQTQEAAPAQTANPAPEAPAQGTATAQSPAASEAPVPAPSAAAPPQAEAQPQLAPATTLGAPDAGSPAAAPSLAAPQTVTPEVVAPRALPPAMAPAPSPTPAAPAAAPGAATPGTSAAPPASAAPPPLPAAAPEAPGAQPAEKGDEPKANAPPTPSKPVDPRIDTGPIVKPPVHAGDSWLYRRSNGKNSVAMRQTAVKVSDDVIALRTELLRSPDNSTVLYDREWGLMASGYNEYRPALHYYSFPLYAGKRWSINTAISNFGAAQTSRVKGEAWATGWEQVEVPAGRFLALRIEIDVETSDPGNPDRTVRVRETHWYVRTVLRPVKVESHSVVGNAEPTGETVEMLSYRMGD